MRLYKNQENVLIITPNYGDAPLSLPERQNTELPMRRTIKGVPFMTSNYRGRLPLAPLKELKEKM